MSPSSVDLSDPLSSAEFAVIDEQRRAEIDRRHALVRDLLEREGYAALLIQQPGNFAWITGGQLNQRGGLTGQTGAVFVTPDARLIACSNANTAQFFEAEVSGLGFQLKERPWFEPRGVMVSDLCRGRRVASDTGVNGTDDVSLLLLGMRLPLSDYEVSSMREAGKIIAHAVEATARGMTRGRTEAEIAGEVAHRLIKRGVDPQRIQVVADGRGRRFRYWNHDQSPVHRYCTISVVGRYRGLFVGAARTVSLGEPPRDLLEAFERAALVAATGMFFSQPEWELFEVWSRVRRIYEKSGAASEWQQADQADIVEYEFGSVPLMPSSEFRLTPGVPIFWHPSVGPALLGETVVVTKEGTEVLTPATDWPTFPISVKGVNVKIPAILVVNN
ncbi:M24 family metallopeptidase [Schlesneria sp. DSM 10557]|uniref:M24 family metallopeptidase n=1 Tax=Schlesneria sp. DSM 10557 TaxID=3044399 RepID=UPI0035A04588